MLICELNQSLLQKNQDSNDIYEGFSIFQYML